jgi:hypothetical protein
MTTVFTAYAGNRDTNMTSGCARDTASGTNRSGTCALTQGSGTHPRRGTAGFSHQQFNLSTSASHVSHGSFSQAHLEIVLHNSVTPTIRTRVRHGTTGTLTRGRVALRRPYSAAVLGQ